MGRDSGDIVSANLDTDFVVGVGETAVISSEGLSITFIEVTEDSRCPVDVTCVWEGNAATAIELAHAMVETPASLNTALEPRTATLAGYTVKLIGLAPKPREQGSIDPASYRATFRVSLTTEEERQL